MHNNNVLSSFKIDWYAYVNPKSQDSPEVPLVNDKDNGRKVIKWVPTFLDCLARTYGARGPLSYVLQDDATVPAEANGPLDANTYYGQSCSLRDELVARLPHTGVIYKK